MPSTPCSQCGRAVPAGALTCPFHGTPVDGDVEETFVPRDPAVEATQSAVDPLLGAQLGDYVVRERLGQGGMGIVYSGEQPLIGKRVAIKVLRPEIARDPEQVQRLLAEARAVNAIRHRGIIDIFNFGELPDGRHYVVMELLAGVALDQLIAERGALPPVEALEILDEIMAALGAGHGAGIIHRDLKPSNVFLVRQPDGTRYVKLLDFGLAKVSAQPRSATPQTRTDMFVGTPEYVAPEQARAESVGPYTDLYAAGVLAFEILTGQLPFTANSPIEWVMRHLDTLPPAPSTVAGGIPAELDDVVLRLMAKEPSARPPSAESVRRELARIRRGLASAATQLGALPQGFPAAAPDRAPAPSTLTNKVPPRKATDALRPASLEGDATLPAWLSTGQRPTLDPAPALPSRSAPPGRSRLLLIGGGVGLAILVALGSALALRETTPRPMAPLPRRAELPPAPPPAPAPEPAERLPPTPAVPSPAPAAVAPAGQVKPAVVAAPVEPRPAPRPVGTATPRPPRDTSPTTRELLSEIDRVEKAMRGRGYDSGSLQMQLLNQYRERATRAEDPGARKEVRGSLRAFEKKHLGS